MKPIYVVLLMAALSMLAGGDSVAVPRSQLSGNDSTCEELMSKGATREMLAQQKCCEKNKGVCGCRAGKIVCCDKSFSTTCTC